MNQKILLPKLISMLASATGKPKKEAENFIKGFFSVLTEALSEHEQVKIKGLGTFKVNRVEPRKSVDVSTGSQLEIPSHFKIVFTPAKSLADKINEEFAWLEVVELSDNITTQELEEIDTGLEFPTPQKEQDITEALPTALTESQEEKSEELGEEIEKEFGEIEPVEPFGPVDPEDPEPGEPIPEDQGEPISVCPPLIMSPEEIATKTDIEGVNRNIKKLKGKVNRNENNNKRRFRAVFFLILFLCVLLLGGGAFCIYKIWENEAIPCKGITAAQTVQGKTAEEPGEPSESLIADSTAVENPADSEEPKDTEKAVDRKEDIQSREEIAPTAPSDIKQDKIREKKDKEENRKVTEEVKAEPEKEKKRTDTITKTRFLITMSREYYGNQNFWPYIYIENSSKLGRPDRIKPGTKVVIPDLKKYGVDPNNPKDEKEAIMLGKEIYDNFK